jgi:RNA polymerase sigma-70 factor, ECF subfamily
MNLDERAGDRASKVTPIHEAYIRLVGQRRAAWQNRAHFFGVAAQMMRRILVDHAGAHRAIRRPGAALRVSFDDAADIATQLVECEIVLLDQALAALAELDSRQAHIVELRYFAGCSEQEIADALSVSRSTVTREWQSARAWMYRRLTVGRRRGTR